MFRCMGQNCHFIRVVLSNALQYFNCVCSDIEIWVLLWWFIPKGKKKKNRKIQITSVEKGCGRVLPVNSCHRQNNGLTPRNC